MMKRNLPNIVTALRILGAACLLFCEVAGAAFWSIYLLCGISDIADGFLARKLGAASKTGALLDSAADLVFIACCCIKIIPVLEFPDWLWIWGGVIVAIKIANQIYSLAAYKKCIFPHTIFNKATGLLLFIALPFSFQSVMPMAITASIATYAAIHEGLFIKSQPKPNC